MSDIALAEADLDAPYMQDAPNPGPPDLPDYGQMGLPHDLKLTKLSDEEARGIEQRLYTADELPGVTFTKVDAPPNVVFDQDKNRTLSLPQSLSETETGFVIKRDADEIKTFFAMEDVGGFEALGRGAYAFVASQPQTLGGLMKEMGETSANQRSKPTGKYQVPPEGKFGHTVMKFFVEQIKKFPDPEELAAKGDLLIERNKKYMADAKLERPEQGGVAGIMYDIGNGGASMLASVGFSAMTRNPATAAIYFAAMQKSSIYQEARTVDPETGEPSKTPQEASDLSSVAGLIEGGLEFVGLDYFMKALKGNSAVKRFISGFGIEATQEGSQATGEELVTQFGGVREKPIDQTVQDILYQAALGGIIGGSTNATLGVFAQEKAIDAGMPQDVADKIAKYVTDNVDSSKANMTEFIDRELAPIARDEASAQEFITLMQQFGNDQTLVERDSLNPEQREAFDKYIEIFNTAKFDERGVGAVEKQFYNQAIEAGVSQDEAVASSKLVGARADAASRALGISPEEWYNAKKIRFALGDELKAKQKKSDDVARDQIHLHLGISKKKLKQMDLDLSKVGAAGSATFGENEIIISLFNRADKSTLPHELGHIFLRDMRDVAKVTNRPRVRKDYETIKKWLGATGDKFTVAQEEKFARGFEKYLRDGVAPKPELQTIFDRFKQWLESIYKSATQLNVNVSPEVKEVFDRMLGADFVQQQDTLNQEAASIDREADYAIVAGQNPSSTLLSDTGEIFKDLGNVGADVFTPVSTRLGKINLGIKHAVRKFIFDRGLRVREDHLKIQRFVDAVYNKFTPEDYRVLDLALKNRDAAKVDFLVDKYGVQKDYKDVRDLLDKLYVEAQKVGLDMGYIEDYFPREVKRGMVGQYIAEMRNQVEWSDIEIAMRKADPDGVFTPEEQAKFVNNYLRGYQPSTITLAKSKHTKNRSVKYVTPEYNKYYEDSLQTLINYVSGVRHGIEERKFFGKSENESEDDIGSYVLKLVQDGAIRPEQEAELRTLLRSIFKQKGVGRFIAWTRDASYVYTMGSPISAITQIQDLAFSLYKNGYFNTGRSLIRSLTGRAILTKEELGLENIMQEFSDTTRSANAVRSIFKLIGLEFMDNMGKQTYVDAAYDRLIKTNKKGGAAWDNQLEAIFGEQAEQVKSDLSDGTMSDEVKYLLFSELSDMQPISIAELPVGYSQGGNWRVLYMLKTYTIKQIDIFRREAIDEIASREPVRVAKGFKNLASLSIALMLMGMGTDELKDLLLGRETEPSEMVMNNIYKLFGINKYNVYKAREEGIIWAALLAVLPPQFSIGRDIQQDIKKVASGDRELRDSKTLGQIPIGGKIYYNWWGGGSERAKKQNAKKGKKKVSTP